MQIWKSAASQRGTRGLRKSDDNSADRTSCSFTNMRIKSIGDPPGASTRATMLIDENLEQNNVEFMCCV